jgi:HEPN domain-containing protein
LTTNSRKRFKAQNCKRFDHKIVFIHCNYLFDKNVNAKDEYENMIERSERFLLTAERSLEEGFLDISSFNANQSLDLFLKGLLLKSAGDFPHTHDIKEFLRTLAHVGGSEYSKKINKYLKEKTLDLKAIQDAYITARYFFVSTSENEVDQMIELIKKLREDLGDVR